MSFYRSMEVDGIPSYQVHYEITRTFFDIKDDHEQEYEDMDEEIIPCFVCEYEYSQWSGSFRSCDGSEQRDISIRF